MPRHRPNRHGAAIGLRPPGFTEPSLLKSKTTITRRMKNNPRKHQPLKAQSRPRFGSSAPRAKLYASFPNRHAGKRSSVKAVLRRSVSAAATNSINMAKLKIRKFIIALLIIGSTKSTVHSAGCHPIPLKIYNKANNTLWRGAT